MRKVQKIQDAANRTEEAYWRAVSWQIHTDDEAEKDSADVTVFLSSNLRERGNPFGKVTEVVIWGEASTPCINFGRAKDRLDPVDNVFDNALVELV